MKSFMEDAMKNIFENSKEPVEKNPDDGTVRWMIQHGDYHHVAFCVIKPLTSDFKRWNVRSGLGKNTSFYYAPTDDDSKKRMNRLIKNLLSICKNEFNREDILLIGLGYHWVQWDWEVSKRNSDKDDDYGLIFTDNKIYAMSHGKLDYIIEYTEIAKVKDDGNDIILTVEDGETVRLECGDDFCHYNVPRNDPDAHHGYGSWMKELILDIMDRM